MPVKTRPKKTAPYMASINKMRRGALTIPDEIRKAAKWKNGQFFEIIFDKKKKRLYINEKHPVSEQVFVKLSSEGEKMVKEAQKEIKDGKFKTFNNAKELIRDLRS